MELSHIKQGRRWIQVGITCLWALWLCLGSARPALADPVAPADDPFHFYAPVAPNNKCMQPHAAGLFGVQYYGDTSRGSAYHNDYLSSGASWIRNSVDWATVEPANTTPENYKWATVDTFVGMAAADCAAMVLTLGANPTWASSNWEGPIDRVDKSEFVQFVSALVERYDGDGVQDAPNGAKVFYFEIYNEPDAGVSGPEERWGLHGDAYADLLKVLYPAVKAANPSAQVVIGGLAYDFFTDQDPITPANNGPFVRKFLEDVLKNGGGAYFDVMNFHFYPLFGSNWTSKFPKDGPGLADKANVIQALLTKYGVTKPIIVTETGWHNNQTLPHGSDTLQVRMLQQLYTQSIAAGLSMVAWWPLGDPGGAYLYNSGLLAAPTQRKPAYTAYYVMARELGTARFVAEQNFGVDIKSYQLQDDAHGRTVYVAWTNPTDMATVWGSAQHPYADTTRTTTIALPGEQMGVYDAFWNKVATVDDSTDGKNDHRVTVTINGDPKYIVLEAN